MMLYQLIIDFTWSWFDNLGFCIDSIYFELHISAIMLIPIIIVSLSLSFFLIRILTIFLLLLFFQCFLFKGFTNFFYLGKIVWLVLLFFKCWTLNYFFRWIFIVGWWGKVILLLLTILLFMIFDLSWLMLRLLLLVFFIFWTTGATATADIFTCLSHSV